MKDKIIKNQLHVKIASPFELYFEGTAEAVSGINQTGPFDILPHHANFLSILIGGSIEVHTGQKRVTIPLSRGIMRVSNNKVEIFADV